jgi:DnaJ family protein B protein 4
MPNYYETLEIGNDASEAEIKKAYRTMSLKWHPDRNPSPESRSRFQDINQAYETLSDPVKRAQYNDELNGVPNNMFEVHMDGMGGGMPDIGHIFNMMFAGGMPGMPGMPGMRGGGMPEGIHVFHSGPGGAHFSMGGGPGINLFQQMHKPPSIIKNIQIPFQLAYSGCTLHVPIEKWVMQNNIKVNETETVYVPIPAGVDNGEVIVIRDCGNTVNDDLKGDVKFIVAIENTTPFTREGMNIHYKKTITLKESLVGFSFDVEHVNGQTICINNRVNCTIIKPGYTKTIPGLGMNRDNNTGSFVIEFTVEFPDALTETQLSALRDIL